MSAIPELSLILYILLIQFLAAFIKAWAGFGNTEITVPLLSLRMNTAFVTPSNALLDIPSNAYLTLHHRKHVRIKKYVPYMAFNIVGSLIGAYVLKMSPPLLLKLAVGVFIILLGIKLMMEEMRERQVSIEEGKDMKPSNNPYTSEATAANDGDTNSCITKTPPTTLRSGGICFLSGLCGGVIGVNIFFLPLFQKLADNDREFKGSICFLFTLNAILRVPAYYMVGLLTGNVLWIALFSLAGNMLGLLLGNGLEKYVRRDVIKILTYTLIIGAGVSLIIKTLAS